MKLTPLFSSYSVLILCNVSALHAIMLVSCNGLQMACDGLVCNWNVCKASMIYSVVNP